MASSRGSFASNTLHGTAITKKHVRVVVDQIVAGFVEDSCSVRLGDSETDGIGKTLAERASGDFNARSIVGLGVSRSDAVNLLRCGVSGRFQEGC